MSLIFNSRNSCHNLIVDIYTVTGHEWPAHKASPLNARVTNILSNESRQIIKSTCCTLPLFYFLFFLFLHLFLSSQGFKSLSHFLGTLDHPQSCHPLPQPSWPGLYLATPQGQDSSFTFTWSLTNSSFFSIPFSSR